MARERRENVAPAELLPDTGSAGEAEEYEADGSAASEPPEADPADAAEQRRELLDPVPAGPGTGLPPEADPADAAEQDREVGPDDDDYR